MKINDQFDSATSRKSHIFAKIALWAQNGYNVLETFKKLSKLVIFKIFEPSLKKIGFEPVILTTQPQNIVFLDFGTVSENLVFFPFSKLEIWNVRVLERRFFWLKILMSSTKMTVFLRTTQLRRLQYHITTLLNSEGPYPVENGADPLIFIP